MCNNLRKVKFNLGQYCFDPDASESEIEEMEEFSRERNGYFHKWVEDVDLTKDVPFVKTMALVEDMGNQKLHFVDVNLMKFIDKPFEK